MRRFLLFAFAAVLPLVGPPLPSALAAPIDVAVPDGHFFSEAGGGGGRGFTIADGPSGRFWSSFQALGGVAALGYPASAPYQQGGFTYQATQGALLQWRPELGRAVLANTFQQLSAAGDNAVLYQHDQIPYPIADDGSGGDYARAKAIRLGWLADPAIAAAYRANPNPAAFPHWTIDDAIQRYGLPMSRPEPFGPFTSQRFQRVTLQHWTEAVAGMPKAGSVVRVLGGDLAKAQGLVPLAAQRPVAFATTEAPLIAASRASLSGPVRSGATIIPPVASINQFPLFPCRASATDPHVNQDGVPVHHAPEAGLYQQYTNTAVELVHNDNCWSPSQLQAMGNHRAIADITEVVIHWTDLDYQRSVTALEGGVSVHYLVPLAPSAAEPPLELIDPRNAAWHAGPLNNGLWEDQAHTLCFPRGGQCLPNGNVHSIGFENVGSSPPNAYQVDVMTDIIAGLISEGYPIVLDRQHVVGHREINSHKPDPGDLDIDHVIALVRQKLAAPAVVPAAPQPVIPAPTPTPAPVIVADGTAAHPFPFSGGASGQLTGDAGGKSIFYTLPNPSGQPLTVTLAYSGMAASPGAVLLTLYQDSQPLGQVSPPGNSSGGQSVTVTPRAGAALTLRVMSYLPQTISYTVSAHG